MVNYRHAVLYGAGIALVMMLGAAGVQYIFRLFLARTQSLEALGLYFAVWSLVNAIFGFRALGTAPAFARIFSTYRTQEDSAGLNGAVLVYLALQWIISLPIAFVLILLSTYLAEHYFHLTSAAPSVIIMSCAFLFTPVFSAYRAYFMAHHRTGIQSSIELLQNIAIFLWTVLSVIYFDSNIALACSVFLGYFSVTLWCLITFFRSSSVALVKPRFDKSLYGELISFGVPITAGNILSSFLGSIDTFLITYFIGVQSVAIYAVAAGTINVIRYIPRAVATTVLPVSTELYLKQQEKLAQGLRLIWKYLVLFLLPLTTLLIIESRTILTLLYGPQFGDGSIALALLSIGTLFAGMYAMNNNILFALNLPKAYTRLMIYGCLLLLLIGTPLSLFANINGVAFASMITSIILCVYSVSKIKTRIGIRLPWSQWFGATLIATLAGSSAVFLSPWIAFDHPIYSIIKSAIIIGTIYGVGVYVTKIVSVQELLGNDITHLKNHVSNYVKKASKMK